MAYLNDALARLVAVEKEAITGCDAVPYFLHNQENFPYFVNRVVSDSIEQDSEEYDVRTYTVLARLYAGYVTQDYVGNLETQVYDWIVACENRFNDQDDLRPFLTSAAYPNALDGMHDLGMRCTDTQVIVTQNAGIGVGGNAALIMAVEFTLEIPFHIPVLED